MVFRVGGPIRNYVFVGFGNERSDIVKDKVEWKIEIFSCRVYREQ